MQRDCLAVNLGCVCSVTDPLRATTKAQEKRGSVAATETDNWRALRARESQRESQEESQRARERGGGGGGGG
eukprot:COSAG03_NODE_18188_length_360_cov_0.781609_1_plen_71_part_01